MLLASAMVLIMTLLIGADVRDIARLWDQMYRSSLPYGRKGLALMAVSVADLALWDLRERYTVSETDFHSRSSNCAFLGREVQGRCLLTLAGGRIAHTTTARVAA